MWRVDEEDVEMSRELWLIQDKAPGPGAFGWWLMGSFGRPPLPDTE